MEHLPKVGSVAVFHTIPLSLLDWLVIILCTSLVLVIGEMKRLFIRSQTRPLEDESS